MSNTPGAVAPTVERIPLTCHISISRASGGRIYLSLEDTASGIRIIEASMTAEQLGNAVTGLYTEGVRVEYARSPNIGKVREVRSVALDIGESYPDASKYEEFLTQYAAPLEVNGWIASNEGGFNHHRCVRVPGGGWTYKMTYVRFVDKPEATNE